MATCKECLHAPVCEEVNSLKCRKDFAWYRAESGCPHFKPAADVAPRSEFETATTKWAELYAESQSKWEKAYTDLEYTLIGVMHSVDKWLEGDELKQDEVNRAATMREKTLRIIENAKRKVAREIFEALDEMVIPEKCTDGCAFYLDMEELSELKKKYTEDDMELSTKRIRELIACPQFGDDHYGEWGCLAYDQRKAMLQMVETIDRQQAEIENLSIALEVTRDNLGDAREELNRAETEIERLDKLVIEKHTEIDRLDNYIQYTRAEAIKEFAVRFKEKLLNLARMHMQHGRDEIYFSVSKSFIDNLAKELTEEKK